MKISQCCGKNEFELLEEVFDKIDDLSDLQKSIINRRYISVLSRFSSRSKKYSILFHLGHFIITVGSLIVPALMSVQYSNAGMENTDDIDSFQTNVYWITWFISVMVTTCNGVLTLFKIDKKYFFLHTVTEKMRSEGWQFLALTGRYSNIDIASTHSNQFVEFCRQVEKIKLKQIDEEYYKQEDKTKQIEDSKQQGNSINAYMKSNDIISSPTGIMRNHTNPVINEVIDTIIRDARQKTKDISEEVSINVQSPKEIDENKSYKEKEEMSM